MSQTPTTLETLTGPAITPVLPELARLRIQVFRDWPYLYDGDLDYEREYLATLAAAPHAAIVTARQADAIVGASTCLPLPHETPNIQAPFLAAGIPAPRVFYFGESVLLPACRGQGIGVAFFTAREAHARAALPSASIAAFCKVRRDPADPRRPPGFTPLHAFWRKRGFTHRPDLACAIDWRELGDPHDSPHCLEFWLKSLTGAPLP